VVTHTVPVGSGPRAIAITPDGRTAVVTNNNDNTVSIIDVETGTVTHTVTVGNRPTGVAISRDGTTAFVAVYGTFGATPPGSALHWIDLASGVITCTLGDGVIPVYPTNVIVSPDGLFLYVYTTSPAQWLAKVQVSDGSFVGPRYQLSISSSISRVSLSPDGQRLAISPVIATSGIDFVDASTMGLLQTIPVSIEAGYVAYSSDGSALFVTDRAQDEVMVIDTSTYGVTRWPSGGDEPSALVPATSGNVFVSNRTSGDLAQLFSGSVRSEVTVMDPATPVLTESQDRVLVPSGSGNALAIITASSLARELVAVGASPANVATARGYAVVSNNGSNTVSIIRLGQLPASGDQVPTAPLQQFGRIESHVCSTDIPDSVLFPGVGEDQRRDGWTRSWAQWPNGGTGGFVCTRQPYFTNTGQWAVG
jgi:YVTN family beta-propeller protein